jgi:two-component system, OmpR family, sensor histidine kinase BaeS
VFRTLAVKLTLAFLLVGLTGSILVAVIIQQRTRTAFDNFILSREQQNLAENLIYYYQMNGSWIGVADDLARIQTFIPFQPNGMRNPSSDGSPLTLVGSDQIIIYSNQSKDIGEKVSSRDLKSSVALQANGKTIGWLLLTPVRRTFTSNTPEGIFLRNVNSATLLSAIVAVLLALILGGLLAFTMTRSLRDLTEATVEIAKGRFGKQVKVRSKDEIGELATSFNKMSLDLDQATKARQQMTADIAHDLRSPLSVITGYAEALSDNKLPGTPEVYNILLQETKHLDRLVDDLRLLTLADTGELPLNLQPISPYALIERVAARQAVNADQLQLGLRLNAQQDLPMVNVDVERMSQVLDNLIQNAFRYTPNGGEVWLGSRVVADQVEITVSDNGKGISPEDLPHVFDRFYRGDKSRQNSAESGLGLAIAKSIVEAHAGKISVDSQPDQGAKFTILLNTYNPGLV